MTWSTDGGDHRTPPLAPAMKAGEAVDISRESQGAPAVDGASRLTHMRDLVLVLVGRDMKLRYKGSALGIGWSLVNPLAQLLVFLLVFTVVLPLNIPNYSVFVFSGLIAWTWFQAGLLQAATSILDSRDLIRRPGLPVPVLPVVTVTTHFVHFVLALPILFVFLLIEGIPVTRAIAGLPLLVALQFVFTLALSYVAAAWHVRFRDTQHLLGIFLMLAFYLTPIFYDISRLPQDYQRLYALNPMVHLIGGYRDILLYGRMPAMGPLAVLAGASLALLAAGYRLFERASHRFVEEL